MGGPPAKSAKSATIRLVFSLERSEDPRLFDDLAAMRKGVNLTMQQRLTPIVRDGAEVDTTSLTQVRGDITVIIQVRAVRARRPSALQVTLAENEVRSLCIKAREIFMQQPILLELEAPIKICGAS